MMSRIRDRLRPRFRPSALPGDVDHRPRRAIRRATASGRGQHIAGCSRGRAGDPGRVHVMWRRPVRHMAWRSTCPRSASVLVTIHSIRLSSAVRLRGVNSGDIQLSGL